MSACKCSSPYRQISLAMWNTYVVEALPANVNIGVTTNHTVGAMCTMTGDGNLLPIYFTIPSDQLSKFKVLIAMLV